MRSCFDKKNRKLTGWRVLSLLLVLLWTIGQFARDRTWLSGFLFYFPSPCLCGWLLTGALRNRRRSAWGMRYYLLLVIPPLFMVAVVENQWTTEQHEVESSETPLRLMHWNVCHGLAGWDEQCQRLLAKNPDLFVVSEPPENWSSASFPGYQCLPLNGMMVACRGHLTLKSTSSLVEGGALLAYEIDCDVAGKRIRIVAADHTSSLRAHRNPSLQRMNLVLAKRKPHIIVGDFNAPRRSLAFSVLPEGFRHAYDECGSGWSYTWPVPIPVLAIDQCIIGPEVVAHRYELQSTTLSDHRLQLLDFSVQENPEREKLPRMIGQQRRVISSTPGTE
ncbi:MAG: hypothetical protein KDA96_09655 [Planctomycetaceae bacterium]|nr:hypothetical protein [Planctomycetaceae bacterium]